MVSRCSGACYFVSLSVCVSQAQARHSMRQTDCVDCDCIYADIWMTCTLWSWNPTRARWPGTSQWSPGKPRPRGNPTRL